jgi:2-dehydropantoate 2-reductase
MGHEIKKIAILGAGALGAMYAAKITKAPGLSVGLVARGSRADRLRAKGLLVNGQRHHIPVIDPDRVGQSPCDLIIVALKHHHLAEAAKDLKYLVGPETILLSVMNGLDSEAILGSLYGMDKMLYCVSVGMDSVREGNMINYQHAGRLVFGDLRNEAISERVERVQRVFEQADIQYETPVDMQRVMWWKFMVNVGMNQSTAVMGVPYNVMQTSSQAQAVMEALMKEVIQLAQLEGVDLDGSALTEWYKVLHTLSPQGKTSMHQDIEARRKTEVEIFAGKVVELGKKHHFPTPVNQTFFDVIRVMEENFPGTK